MANARTRWPEEVKAIAKAAGIDCVGFADLRGVAGIFTYPHNLIEKYPFAVSLVVSLGRYGKYDSTTEDEFAFPLIDQSSRSIRKYIAAQGFHAKVVLADKRVGRESPVYWLGEISHKAVAKTAGLGWIGKSTLLVTQDFGPRVCVGTVLTDMPLPCGSPSRNRCGTCRECVQACPIGALKFCDFEDHPQDVKDCVDVISCDARVEKTHSQGRLCFECMLACPRGRAKR